MLFSLNVCETQPTDSYFLLPAFEKLAEYLQNI